MKTKITDTIEHVQYTKLNVFPLVEILKKKNAHKKETQPFLT